MGHGRAPDPTTRTSRAQHWLYGRWIDLLVGCCGIYTLSIPLLLGLTASAGITTWPAGLVLLLVLATAIAMEGIQGANSSLVFAPGTLQAPDMPQVLLWPPLHEHATVLLSTTIALYLATLFAAYYRMRATAMVKVGSATALVVVQALFSVVPVTLVRLTSQETINLAFAPVWLSMAHSAQYLWVSAYFAKRSGAQQTSARFLWKSFIAGSGITVLPAVLFAPSLLGDRPWDAGLAGLVFAMVNLHHFIMDGAIWKLRDNREGRVLLREDAAPPDAATSLPARHRASSHARGMDGRHQRIALARAPRRSTAHLRRGPRTRRGLDRRPARKCFRTRPRQPATRPRRSRARTRRSRAGALATTRPARRGAATRSNR
ncbi:MAG: hypothetical protein QF570_10115 [Myxococcota bacterium]|jgi:hypothetical protein|nr:hypothetical protein [Myxococcota bacterium]